MKVIAQHGQSKLVEYEDAMGRLQRCYVPADVEPTAEILDQGIPYGVPWERLVDPISAEQLADALRRAGIWTLADLRAHSQQALHAIWGVIGLTVSTLKRKAKDWGGNYD